VLTLLPLFILPAPLLLVMDNLNGDMAPRPDPQPNPPGTEDFEFCYVDAHFDSAGSMLTMTNP
jgi:hypothetical protein